MALRPTVTWLVATHYRPALLRAALSSIYALTREERYWHEIIVVRHTHDHEAAEVLEPLRSVVRELTSSSERCAGKRNHGLRHAGGTLLLVADDDDIQSPLRAAEAVAAYEAGHPLTSVMEFRQLHLSTGDVVRWTGVKDASGPMTGRARNYDTEMVRKIGGWDEGITRGIDSHLTKRFERAHKVPGMAGLGHAVIREHDLGVAQADGLVCIQHATNLWDRPVVSKDRVHRHGGYMLKGEGHWTTCENFPVARVKNLFVKPGDAWGRMTTIPDEGTP